jgi:hypothetical protein
VWIWEGKPYRKPLHDSARLTKYQSRKPIGKIVLFMGDDSYDLVKGWLPVEDAYINPESQYWLILPGRELYKY